MKILWFKIERTYNVSAVIEKDGKYYTQDGCETAFNKKEALEKFQKELDEDHGGLVEILWKHIWRKKSCKKD